MKVGIIHNSLNSVGGGERVCLKTIEALKESGYETVLATVEPTDWERVDRIMGGTVKPDEELSLINFKVRMFGIYLRLLTTFLASKLRKLCDLVINTHGDVLPIEADIIYMHYPTFALMKENPVNIKYSQSLFWRAYFIPYEAVQRILVKRFLSGVILTNSVFSKRAIKKYTGRDASIVYPPVEIDKFTPASRGVDRERIVVTCGRYTPEKNYEFVLRVAERLSGEARFMIIGASSGRISQEYYRRLSMIKEEKGLENVELLRDLPFDELLNVYSRARVYLHTMRYEHFGIAVVEAMAAGLVPVVHRSGGPWEDILKGQQGLYGFSYSNLDDACEVISRLVKDGVTSEIVKRNLNYVQDFSAESYKKRILHVVEELAELM